MPTPLSISSSADLLAFIPSSLGFWPSESIAVIGISREDTAGAVLRVDLQAALGNPDAAATTVADLINNASPTKTVAAIFSPSPLTDGRLPHLDVALALHRTLPDCQTVFWVGPDTVHSYTTGESFPVDEVKTSPLALEMLAIGRSYGPSPSVEIPEAPEMAEDDAELIEATAEALQIAGPDAAGGDCVIHLWNAVLNGQEATPNTELAMLGTLKFKPLRDLAMATMVSSDLPDPADLAGIGTRLMGGGATAPNWTRIEKAEVLLKDLLKVASGELRAEPLALLGAIEWFRGKGTPASHYLEAALTASPGHRLASLLLEAVSRGILAPWAKNSATAYRKN